MRSVVTAGVARQQAVLLWPTAVVATGLRDALLRGFHHLLVLASAVLEPDLNLQHTEEGSVSVTSRPGCCWCPS